MRARASISFLFYISLIMFFILFFGFFSNPSPIPSRNGFFVFNAVKRSFDKRLKTKNANYEVVVGFSLLCNPLAFDTSAERPTQSSLEWFLACYVIRLSSIRPQSGLLSRRWSGYYLDM